LRRSVTIGRALVHEARTENVTFMAGSIAYHAFISLLPFLLVILLAVTATGNAALADRIVALASGYLTPNSTELLGGVLTNAAQSTSVTFVGVIALLWGAFKIFRSLDTAFSDIYESEHLNTITDQFGDAVVVFLALAAGVVAVTVVGSVVTVASDSPLAPLNTLPVVAALAVAFFPLYYVFPDEDVTVREVLPGTVFAAVGWTALEGLFQYYVAVASKSETYGILGAILLVLTWLYFSGLVILLGAVVNAVLAGRSEDTRNLGWNTDAATDSPAVVGERDIAPFLDPLERLQAAVDADTPLTLRAGDVEVELPPPTERTIRARAIDRPRLLGGYREDGEIRFRWTADAPVPDEAAAATEVFEGAPAEPEE
jgi:membrane protein